MIVGEKFIWLHFPKNAGTKIENIFRKYIQHTSIVQDNLDLRDGHWHDSIIERNHKNLKFSSASKKIIVCVRKLQPWLISRYNFEVMRSPQLGHDYTRLLRGLFLEESGFENHADYYIDKYMPDLQLNIDNYEFIRIENFELDFMSVFSKYIDVESIPRSEFKNKENSSKMFIPEEFIHHMSSNIQDVYNSCPLWSKMEKLVYG